jgi:hypothetical protein
MSRITIMSGPIKFRILAIVIGIKKLGYVCFVRKLCSVQSIHTELAKLYSQKVISRMVCLAYLWGGKFDPRGLSRQREWNKDGAAPVVLNKWKDV